MYYRKALELQAFLDLAEDDGWLVCTLFFLIYRFTFLYSINCSFMLLFTTLDLLEGYRTAELMSEEQSEPERLLWRQCQAIADMKFTYVVSCQQYGIHKRIADPRAQDILKLMITYVHYYCCCCCYYYHYYYCCYSYYYCCCCYYYYYYFLNHRLRNWRDDGYLMLFLFSLSLVLFCSYPALRVAYIDEIEEPNKDKKIEKVYYSVLVKAAISRADSSDEVVQNLDQVMHCFLYVSGV
jgi:hypothetical protein